MPSLTKVNQVGIKLGGQYLAKEIMAKLFEVQVDTSLYVPAMFILRFRDDDLAIVDDEQFDISKSIEIEFPDAKTEQLTSVIAGEITGIEPEFSEHMTSILTIRGYDKGHRLNRGTNTRVFQNMTDTDIVRKIAQETGFQVTADATTVVHEHVFQHNQTNFAFLRERAHLNGFELVVTGEKLFFRAGGIGESVDLAWGTALRSFRPRVVLADQVTEVKVRGWDAATKRALVANARSSKMQPTTGMPKPEALAAKFSTQTQFVEVHQPVTTQAEADKLAQSLVAEIDSGFIEAEGLAFGSAGLVAGKKVNLTNLGKRFSGAYFVTSATHIYSNSDGYDTHFVVEGVRRRLTADLVNDSENRAQRFGGVFPALVTNLKDPKNMGRVKLKFPWLDENSESAWARISTVGGGAKRGIFWLPEVNDEVLVAFEHGDFNQPYILGGLYNGRDAPPATANEAVPASKVEKHLIQTNRHLISLTDNAGSEVIEIKDLSDQAVVRLTTKPGNKIEIISKGTEVDIECAQGTVNVKAMTINAKATQEATVSAVNVKVEATAQLDLKGAMVNVEASGPLKIKGAIVNIN